MFTIPSAKFPLVVTDVSVALLFVPLVSTKCFLVVMCLYYFCNF